MAAPTEPEKRRYMFTDDMKFLQKAIVHHPRQDKFLALRRSDDAYSRPGSWDLPGGNVLFGESHLASLMKEISEETSLKVKDVRPIQVATKYEKQTYYLFIGYSCQATSSKAKTSDEHQEYRWVTKDEFLKLESADFLIDLVKNLRNP